MGFLKMQQALVVTLIILIGSLNQLRENRILIVIQSATS